MTINNLPHGKKNSRRRVEMRAEAILRGAPWAVEPDDSDINDQEPAEIEAAKSLAADWDKFGGAQ